ncbi:imidazoleglycerol-phosphate dehydratase HisB [Methanobacterium alkalithermotolerans]|uniref:Imidazoleglycerol-phosphate dehydratase n=1 Tax=Methanobacterium alkalithermotolerans TaxID=2731220 RepID=A0A8T8KDJ1_9EURY|nr:imidazoleglycerol-phosphate dehydratase HisB [Methanobacterium alkalithermotolerans]QUH23441.1 imidazoleglycerol-phosphate dehydratase HisB [Methanobacterium alkalithermotolerans]
MRKKKMSRKTSETDIQIMLNVDGKGEYHIDTGVEFFNHMLESFARHGFFDLKVKAQGDVGVDDHHTVEDVGLLLGEVFKKALGDKKGIRRMAHAIIPMDEALATVAVDISGRSYCVLDMEFKKQKVGDLSTENVSHFLKSFAQNGGININAKLEGENDHHQIEALFKSLARALKEAVTVEHDMIPSTKGVL